MTKITELPPQRQVHIAGVDYVKTFCKRMLKTSLFMGSYQEKRFVEPLNAYRDVVKVHSDETAFIENLLTVKNKVQSELGDTKSWIGITEPSTVGAPAGYSLWVVLPVQVFGTYWFKVKSVEFLPGEVRVKLEVVRQISDDVPITKKVETEETSFDMKNVSQKITVNLSTFFTENFTLSNIKQSVIFVSLLVSTIIIGGVNLVKYVMEYLLKFIREFSGLVKAFTPIVITCLDLMRKTVFGAFSFVLALIYGNQFRPAGPRYPVNYRTPRYMINYPEDSGRVRYSRSRGLPSRSSVTIEPLDD